MTGFEDLKRRADERFEEAIRRTGARDPRSYYRDRLRALRERDLSRFREATQYFEEVLVPTVAREESDPLAVWLDYGRLLANLWIEGTTVQIDRTGRSRPYQVPVPLDHLVLHLPTSMREPAIAVGLPPELSEPQKLTFELLVRGKP